MESMLDGVFDITVRTTVITGKDEEYSKVEMNGYPATSSHENLFLERTFHFISLQILSRGK